MRRIRLLSKRFTTWRTSDKWVGRLNECPKKYFLSKNQYLKSRTCIWVSCGSTARLLRRREKEQLSSLILRCLQITLKLYCSKYYRFGLFVKYFPFLATLFNLIFWAVSHFDTCRLQWSSQIRWRKVWGTGVPGRRSGWTFLIFLGLLTRSVASKFLFVASWQGLSQVGFSFIFEPLTSYNFRYTVTFGKPSSIPVVGLASYPSSGNTWLRYLIRILYHLNTNFDHNIFFM